MNAYSRRYEIIGDPEALARTRFSPRTLRVYDSQKQLKLILGITLASQHDDAPMFCGPLRVDFKFFFALSPSWSEKKKKLMLGKWMIFAPDTSNLIKLIEDVGQDAGLYKDDCIISCISAEKKYDLVARTEFIITQLSNEKE